MALSCVLSIIYLYCIDTDFPNDGNHQDLQAHDIKYCVHAIYHMERNCVKFVRIQLHAESLLATNRTRHHNITKTFTPPSTAEAVINRTCTAVRVGLDLTLLCLLPHMHQNSNSHRIKTLKLYFTLFYFILLHRGFKAGARSIHIVPLFNVWHLCSFSSKCITRLTSLQYIYFSNMPALVHCTMATVQ